jgi:hypothetical protein
LPVCDEIMRRDEIWWFDGTYWYVDSDPDLTSMMKMKKQQNNWNKVFKNCIISTAFTYLLFDSNSEPVHPTQIKTRMNSTLSAS